MEEDYVIFVEIVEEYFITELIGLEEGELRGIVGGKGEGEKVRLLMAKASLYYSYALLQHPVEGTRCTM